MKRLAFLVSVVVLAVAATSTSLHAAGTIFNTTPEGVAIGGYDPVAYALDRKPSRGKPSISLHWSGATWHFTSIEYRALFQQNPEQYAPAYGGWCAMGMAGGAVVEVDFERGWSLQAGTLYLNVDKDINVRWQRAARRMIKRADKEWPDVLPTILDGSANIFRKDRLPELYQ